ncbi:pyridoxal-phosphate dependent enzyme [Spongiactinospora sp. TRM90649]|uniref:1-aminocyclopropane-1-carboxylate deaminase/D-cysteine desulfhydrase n=1 Tax=Spongiactinospora sp. TRM90649 TaxID=3031114 RepID=UPI0023F69492|nr:pyridoxal-phosphate dependent enzyme [Spongiactinospora sp. TRM90649]MDF5757001.1 pyridoxal-phosphate dependent enzyme [Spongiactinospora sp. TRM90649]
MDPIPLPAPTPVPPSELADDRLGGVRLWLKRDDLIDPEITGNKWRKLRHNLAGLSPDRPLLTFGGAYSGHIRAVAAAGRRLGLATVGVIRGEEHLPLNPSLACARAYGMRLVYLDRSTYRAKDTPEVVAALRARHGDFHLIPEGGSNAAGVRGCAELPAELGMDYDLICCPVGTGGTLAGIAAGLPPGPRAVGFAVLKGAAYLSGEVARLQRDAHGEPTRNWTVDHGFHFGGYAKVPPDLAAFAADFEDRHGLEVERVYVAKMLYGVYARARDGHFPPGTRIVAVITGRRTFPQPSSPVAPTVLD